MKRTNRSLASTLIAAIMALVLVSCGTTTSATSGKTGMKYYDKFVAQMADHRVSANEADNTSWFNITEPTDEMRETVEAAREAIRHSLGEYTDLDWSHFERVPIFACDIQHTRGAVGFYSEDDDCIYLDRTVMRSYGAQTATHAIAHELIHVLALPGNRTNIDEALTVYLAMEACPSDIVTYPFSYAFIWRYLRTHDEKDAIDAMRNGTLAELVENDIGYPGVLSGDCDKLFEAVNAGAINNTNMYVVIDIYTHYVQNTGGLDDASANVLNGMLGYLSDTPESYEAMEYFQKVLDS
jgi:hypothetical protein